MEYALKDTRSKYFEAKENGSPPAAHIPHISSPVSSTTTSESAPGQGSLKSRPVARSLFNGNSVTPKAAADTPSLDAELSLPLKKQTPTDNEVLVNEIIHASRGGIEGYSYVSDRDELSIRVSWSLAVYYDI